MTNLLNINRLPSCTVYVFSTCKHCHSDVITIETMGTTVKYCSNVCCPNHDYVTTNELFLDFEVEISGDSA